MDKKSKQYYIGAAVMFLFSFILPSFVSPYKSVELMKAHVKKTMREEVLGGLGGFSGAFSLAKIKEMEEPVLFSVTLV